MVDVIQKEHVSYIELQRRLEGSAYTPVTQSIIHSLTRTIQTWDIQSADILLIQCGKGLFFHALASTIDRLCVVEPCPETYIELQRHYLHITSFGTSLYHINADTRSFEYTFMLYPILYHADAHELINEAMRVTARGLYMLFFNMCSLEYCLSRMYKTKDYQYYVWNSISSIRRSIQLSQHDAKYSISSIGLFPLTYCETKRKVYQEFPCSIGTIGIIRIEMPKRRVVTPIVTPLHERRKRQLQWSSATHRNTSFDRHIVNIPSKIE